MKAQVLKPQNNNLSSTQLRTFKAFRRRLNEKVPDYRIAWVLPYKETIIEVGLEAQKKWTYKKTRQAAKVAIEVEDKTGVTIVLR